MPGIRLVGHLVPVEPKPASPRSVTSRLGSSCSIPEFSILKCQFNSPGYQGRQCAHRPAEQSCRLPSPQNPPRRGWTSLHLVQISTSWGKTFPDYRPWNINCVSIQISCYQVKLYVTYVPSVIFVHHTSPYVYMMLPGQTRPEESVEWPNQYIMNITWEQHGRMFHGEPWPIHSSMLKWEYKNF